MGHQPSLHLNIVQKNVQYQTKGGLHGWISEDQIIFEPKQSYFDQIFRLDQGGIMWYYLIFQ